MALSLVTAPAVEPISVEEAKLHLRVDATADDALIDTLIKAARHYVETFTQRALITQTWDDKRDGFPCDGVIELAKPPASAVTSVTYVDTAGDTQTWSSSLYQTDLPSGPHATHGRIQPAYAQYYPVARRQMNAVTVRFVAGYGAGRTSVPETLRVAMKLLIGHWYEARTPDAAEAPAWINALLWSFKAS